MFRETPTLNLFELERFEEFVTKWVERHFVPLSDATDLSFETWLDGTNYTAGRKDELRKANAEVHETIARTRRRSEAEADHEGSTQQHFEEQSRDKRYDVNAFQKAEAYNAFKPPRVIAARSDFSKCIFGPIAKAIEKEVFKLKWFIKKIPVRDRPAYLREHVALAGHNVVATDYSKYESSFRAAIQASCERVLYNYMLSSNSWRDVFLAHYDGAVLGTNHVQFRDWFTEVIGSRMSGEMFTSLGNGFSNLVTVCYLLDKQGYDCEQLRGVFEGDDGLFIAPHGFDIYDPTVTRLGFELKITVEDAWNEASFCGNIFAEEENTNITDLCYVIANTPWHHADYVVAKLSKCDAVLRSKALSLIHQYPGHPVLQSYARCLLRITRGRDISPYLDGPTIGNWERGRLLEALKFFGIGTSFTDSQIVGAPISMATRLLYEKKFKMTVEHQMILEDWFDEQQELDCYTHPILDLYMPEEYQLNSVVYVEPFRKEDWSFPLDHHPMAFPYSKEQFAMLSDALKEVLVMINDQTPTTLWNWHG